MTPEQAKEKAQNKLLGVYHEIVWFDAEEEKVVREALEKYYLNQPEPK